ncbi:MAG: helix-turn-helix domain-containing protein [Bacteroidetes bacterium]|nr:helix-turn-helix domain-containing protein [Bacteroidota bacterium]
MNYAQYEVFEDLQPFVKCYWSLDAPPAPGPERQRIVPDGCMEMIFHYGDLYQQYALEGIAHLQPRSFVFGQITVPLEIAPTGITGIIAARFQPDGFCPFSAIPLTSMNDRAVALTELFAEEGSQLEEKVMQAQDNEERIQHIESFLCKKLQTEDSMNRVARSAVQALLESGGQHPIQELATQLQINRRQLERKFSKATGMSPKQYSKVLRLQTACKLIGKGTFQHLTALALEAGYYDQAHFIKDFREFTGVTPRQFYAHSLQMSALFTHAG